MRARKVGTLAALAVEGGGRVGCARYGPSRKAGAGRAWASQGVGQPTSAVTGGVSAAHQLSRTARAVAGSAR